MLTFTAQLLDDINQDPAALELGDIDFREFVVAGNSAYFVHADGGGKELWKTDGTGAGTGRVKDIYPGGESSSAQDLTSVGATLFFVANDGAHGDELWKTDGTEAGTVLLKDIRTGPSVDSGVGQLTNVNGTLFFRAVTNDAGFELWKSDGTENGTVLVKDIRPGSNGSAPGYLTNVDGTLFFSANDGTHGYELWKSDGSSAGTILVKDIQTGPASSAPNSIVAVNNEAFFVARGSSSASELWRSDGSAVGTTRVSAIHNGGGAYDVKYLTNVNGRLFFSANDGTTGFELWKSDGAAANTNRVLDIHAGTVGSQPQDLLNVGGTLYFSADDGQPHRELWRSNGNATGTATIKDIADPSYLTNLNGKLFFAANNGTNYGIWETDGTSGGTALVDQVGASHLANLNGLLLFQGSPTQRFRDDGTQSDPTLWKSDGTSAGTVEVPPDSISTRSAFQGGTIVPAGDVAFLVTNDGRGGEALWKTDGTTAGTVLVKKIPKIAIYTGTTPVVVNGSLFFRASDGIHGYELWESDGTSQGTVMLKDISSVSNPNTGFSDSYPSYFTNVNGTLFFVANDGIHGNELWKSDGTTVGTVPVKDIRAGTSSSFPQALTEMNGRLFFSADDGINGRELWTSDGTDQSTVLLKNISPLSKNSGSPNYLVNVNGKLFFAADDGVHGEELWTSDGTANGTFMVKDIAPGQTNFGPNRSAPRGFIAFDGSVFFTVNAGTYAGTLWRTDGTENTTMMVNSGHFAPPRFAVGGKLLLVSSDFLDGAKLWSSDGTDAGTTVLKDIRDNFDGSAPTLLLTFNGVGFFSATDSLGLFTLWRTDGTEQGTYSVGLPLGDSRFAPTQHFQVFGDQVLFIGQDAVHGRELWSFTETNSAPATQNDTYSVSEDSVLSVPVPGTLANDTDPDLGDTESITAVNGQFASVGNQITLDSGARLTMQADGSFIYDPHGQFDSLAIGLVATDSFVYAVADNHGAASTATVSITIHGVNDPPLATDDMAEVDEDGVLNVAANAGLLTNDTDPDAGDIRSVVGVNGLEANVGVQITLTSGALLTANPDGSYQYETNGAFESLGAGESQNDYFSYTIADSHGAASSATMTIRIDGTNDAPVAGDDRFSTDEDTPLSVGASVLLANDYDADGDKLMFAPRSQPLHGQLVLRIDGSFTYMPAKDYNGADSFTYQVSDGQATSNVATVTIVVRALNDRPVVSLGGDLTVDEGTAFSARGSFADPDSGDAWTASVDYGDGTKQLLALAADKTFSLGHAYRDTGLYTVTVAVQDTGLLTGTASFQVQAKNVPPQQLMWAGPTQALLGQNVVFTGGFSDPGLADTETASVDWGDGSMSDAAVTGRNGAWQVRASHTFVAGGFYTVVVTVKDNDGGLATKSATVELIGAVVSRGTLQIVGSEQRDDLKLTIVNQTLLVSGTLGVTSISQSFPLASVQRIMADLRGGDDSFAVDAKIKLPLLVNAGAGNDVVRAGSGTAVLIGGTGQDSLYGGTKTDLLIAGTTTYDANSVALAAILSEWSSSRNLATRVKNLRTGAGSVLQGTGIKLIVGKTVLNDAGVDTLIGNGDIDWFMLEGKKDKLKDAIFGELFN
jgi:ELWxxDGT repeat protein/VCBS repeat-containing protein